MATAGLLNGYTATTHWAYKSILKGFPGIDVAAGYPRFVIDEKVITGGGISSGIDEAFAIAAILAGKERAKIVQLTMQYAPNPPFNNGDPSVAGPTVLYQTTNELRKGVAATARAFKDFLSKETSVNPESSLKP